jgi:hypothetical protein
MIMLIWLLEVWVVRIELQDCVQWQAFVSAELNLRVLLPEDD